VSANPQNKFIRICYSDGAIDHDQRTAQIIFKADAEKFNIKEYPSTWHRGASIAGLNDGNWHAMVIVSEQLNDTRRDPNYNVKLYIDDWDMSGTPYLDVDILVPQSGPTYKFRMASMFINYGGTASPTNEHAIEYDDFEVWDGLPGGR
jgi:hypothetical protein